MVSHASLFSSSITRCSLQFSRSVVSDSLRPHELQHARPHCPSPTPGVHSNSRPLSRWCHPANSSSAVPFSSCLSIPPNGAYMKAVFSSLQFIHSVVSDSLQPHEPQHTRPLCPSPTPRVRPNPCPSSQWHHPILPSSVVPFSCPQSFPASGSFHMIEFFT